MKKTLLAALLVSFAALPLAGPVLAQDSGSNNAMDQDSGSNDSMEQRGGRCGNVPVGEWMGEQQVRDRAKSMGVDVLRVSMDEGCYEIDARNADGRWVEILLHPQTGEQVAVNSDD